MGVEDENMTEQELQSELERLQNELRSLEDTERALSTESKVMDKPQNEIENDPNRDANTRADGELMNTKESSEIDRKNAANVVEKNKCVDLVERFCAVLAEPNKLFVADIVNELGSERAEALLAETEKVLASGGLATVDGQRKRSPGGTFFYLAREQIGSKRFARMRTVDSRRRKQQATNGTKSIHRANTVYKGPRRGAGSRNRHYAAPPKANVQK